MHLKRISLLQLLSAGLLLAVASVPLSARSYRVIVNASASDEYVEATRNKEIQTYHFVEGAFYRSEKRDNSLRNTEFMDVAKTVAEYLKERKFYPAKDKNTGDLLIQITWGTTRTDFDYTEALGITDLGNNIFAEEFEAQPEQGAEVAVLTATEDPFLSGQGAFFRSRNIRLLGYDKGLYGKGLKDAQRQGLEEDLEEERYFIVLNAFDYKVLRETGELKHVWSSRYSMRNIGTNFIEAMDILNMAAATTFGQNNDSLMSARIDPETEVVIGELEVIGTVEEKKPDAGSR